MKEIKLIKIIWKDIHMTKWYVCQNCGYDMEADEAPEICPACGSQDFELEIEDE